jgi:O-antigen ligase
LSFKISKFYPNITRFEFALFWCFVLIQSLVWSRFLLSVCLWALIILALFEVKKFNSATKLRLHEWIIEYLQPWQWRLAPLMQAQYFNQNVDQKTKEYVPYLALSIPFFLVLISGLWSENMGYWLERLRIRLPFVVLPMAFYFLGPLSKRAFYSLLYFFVVIIAVNYLVMLVNYALHFEEVTYRLGRGKPMPIVKEHITFSIMAVFAFFASWTLWREGFYLKNKIETTFLGGLTLFLFAAIHIVSVRTGILTLYICLIINVLAFIFKEKKYIIGTAALLALMAVPLMAYRFVPSFQMRLNYAVWDFQQYQQGNLVKKSDSERMVSLQMGWSVLKKNPALGVGSGDLMDAMRQEYAQYYPTLEVREPHNGLLFIAASVGFVGWLIFMLGFVVHLLYKKHFHHRLFLTLHMVLLASITIDFIIEASFGTTFYVLFLCLFFNYFKNDKAGQP